MHACACGWGGGAQGSVRSDKTTVDDAIERMRVALSDSERHGSLKKIFQDIDTNNDDGISQQEFMEGMEKVFFF